MLKTLVKKQLFELNRSFFYDPKKGKLRSKSSSAAFIILYVLLMVVVLGGMFTALSLMLCAPFADEGLDWLYMDMMVLIAVMLGVFGSVFNTYSSLYKAKDNDMLLSLPIPTRYVLISRLLGVYLMGLMFSAVVMLPAVIVYFVVVQPGFSGIVGSLVLTVLVSLFVFTLSCLLGWIVARVSVHIKSKSIVIVILSLVFFGLYYFVCFNAYELIQELIINALSVGEKLKSSAYVLYLIGKSGTCDPGALAVITLSVLILFALTYYILDRSFLKIATASDKTAKRKTASSAAKMRSVGSALLSREFSHLLSSPTYMLNCCLGAPIMLIAAVFVLIERADLIMLSQMLPFPSEFLPVMMGTAVCVIASMDVVTAPSVSLEGKSVWIAQSLPVEPKQVLRAKLRMSVLITGIPALLSSVCIMFALRADLMTAVMSTVAALAFVFAVSAFGLIMNLKRPLLSWQNETVPVKQSIVVLIAMFVGWLVAAAIGVGYYLLCKTLPASLYLALICVVLIVLSLVQQRWLDTKGSEIFRYL